MLVKHQDFEPNIPAVTEETILLWSTRGKYHLLTEKLLEIENINVSYEDKSGCTALHWAINDTLEITTSLIKHQLFNPNQTALNGSPVFVWAVETQQKSLVDILLSKEGLNINAQDRYGNTALMWAVKNGDTEQVRLLLAHGAYFERPKALSPRLTSKSLYREWEAWLTQTPEFEKALLEKNTSLAIDLINMGVQPSQKHVEMALQTENPAILHFLLSIGLDATSPNTQGETPLMVAAAKDNILLIQRIIQHLGHNLAQQLNKGNSNGDTALMIAQKNHSLK